MRLWLVEIIAAAACIASTARANGRFPRAERLVEDAADPTHLVLAATYGILETHDRGSTWRYVCERSFSLQDIAFLGDPLVELAGGDTFVGVQASLNVSRDDGCRFERSLFDAHEFVDDFTIVRSTGAILAIVHATDGSSSHLEESTDRGASWTVLGDALPTGLVLSVDVAPSDPARIYVSALASDTQGELLVSADHGKTWKNTPLSNTSVDEVPYIALVHPVDANRIFVRTDAWTNRDVRDTANDALLYSDDGGTTFRELLRRKAKIYGVALSPDASTLLAGYGDPFDPSAAVEAGDTGIYRASTDVFSFERVWSGPVSCLSWTPRGIYVCPDRGDTGMELGFATAASFAADGGALEPLLRLADVEGPLACCAGDAGMSCADDWATTCVAFGACDGGGGTAVSSTPSCLDAGPDVGASDAAPASLVAPSASGCDCALGKKSNRSSWALVFLLTAALWRLIKMASNGQ